VNTRDVIHILLIVSAAVLVIGFVSWLTTGHFTALFDH
jgi:hypothetical protein